MAAAEELDAEELASKAEPAETRHRRQDLESKDGTGAAHGTQCRRGRVEEHEEV